MLFYATGDVCPNREDPDTMFDGVREELSKADLLFGQMEGTMSDRGTPLPQCRLPVRARTNGAGAIARAGFDVMSFAGNHCMDWGREAFYDTMDLLRKEGVLVGGCGENITEARKSVIVEKEGVKIAFLSYNSILPQNYWATDERPGCTPLRGINGYYQVEHDQPQTNIKVYSFPIWEDLVALCEDIKAAKQQADLVMVSMHWGIHFKPAIIADYQKIAAYAAIESGADIIIGHHAHILKPMEFYKDKLIIYSLGNFALEAAQSYKKGLNDLASHKEIMANNKDWKAGRNMPEDSYLSMIFKCDIVDKKLTGYRFVPVDLDDNQTPRALDHSDPQFTKIVEYMRDITADQKMNAVYRVDGDEVLIEQ